MVMFDSIDREKWYPVKWVADYLNYKRDAILRRIRKGHLQALLMPQVGDCRDRVYMSLSIQGCELIRFISENLTELKRTGRVRMRQ
jgi:hypothetical protein